MSKGHLSNNDVCGNCSPHRWNTSNEEQFFLRLSELFDERRQKDHGSVTLTQKRSMAPPFRNTCTCADTNEVVVTHGEDAEAVPTSAEPFPDINPSKPLPIIIRASNSKSKEKRDKKIKLSTIVEVDALEGFYAKYAEVCKAGMSGLKKRDRSKAKEKLKAKKKKQGAGTAIESGSKS